jgi:hypothetical protein
MFSLLLTCFGDLQDDWKVETKPDEGGSFWENFGAAFGGTAKVGFLPDFIKDSAIEGIGFNFDFGTLRFFSVTNVFRESSVSYFDIHLLKPLQCQFRGARSLTLMTRQVCVFRATSSLLEMLFHQPARPHSA